MVLAGPGGCSLYQELLTAPSASNVKVNFFFFKMFYCISSDKSVLPDIPSDISNILKFHVTILVINDIIHRIILK